MSGFLVLIMRLYNPSLILFFSGFNNVLNLRFLIDYISLQFFRVLMIIVRRVFIFALYYLHSEKVRFIGFM